MIYADASPFEFDRWAVSGVCALLATASPDNRTLQTIWIARQPIHEA